MSAKKILGIAVLVLSSILMVAKSIYEDDKMAED